MIGKRIVNILIFFLAWHSYAQQKIHIDAKLNPEKDEVYITQHITFYNSSAEVLDELFLFDWANSFSSKTTPLAKRFAENFSSAFHFEKDELRGKTTIVKINSDKQPLSWDRPLEADILRIVPAEKIKPGETYSFTVEYVVKIPDAKFTRFGVTKEKNYNLKHWLILPAIYDGEWEVFSNKNIDNPYILPTDFSVSFRIPKSYELISDLNYLNQSVEGESKVYHLQGDQRQDLVVYLEQTRTFQTIQTEDFELVTNLHNPRLSAPLRAIFIARIIQFLEDRLGSYPFEKMVVSDPEYRRQPVYGFNLLPNFLSPFPDGFEYDLEQLKTITRQYLENALILHQRKDYWLQNALQVYLMIEYVNTYYPDTKLGGNLSNWWPLQWSHASTLEFNDQYQFLYLNMARQNLQQPLTMERDSLLKFNANLANAYFGASGLNYLKSYIGTDELEVAIKKFYSDNKLKPIHSTAFQSYLKENTNRETAWFFKDFASSENPIDFKISRATLKNDSIEVKIRSRNGNRLPVSIFGLNRKEVKFKTWTPPIDSTATFMIPADGIRRVVVNYDGVIPEINKKNNYKAVKGTNKPFQPRLFRDVENPHYSQLFFIPIFDYNLYDGLSLGVEAHNKNLLPKNLEYSFHPFYGLRSETLVGGGNISYRHYPKEGKLFSIRYGFSGKYFSYNYDLFYKRFSPFMNITFRPKDLRKNERQYLTLRSVSVHRDQDPEVELKTPNYDVFNFQYVYSDQNLIDFYRTIVDYQISSKFSKLSLQLEYRKLFLNNRQLNLRLFSGIFLFNDSFRDDDFFSFALDRPSDYMFDYGYYGRSETQGFFSQQLIIAEGGFKSKLDTAYANSWITTLNASTNIWKWIYAYGDVGLLHNKGRSTHAVFDSGIRLSLVADYFEVFFPVYSSLGFEPNLPDYEQQIRFIVTLNPETLFRLFTRRWY